MSDDHDIFKPFYSAAFSTSVDCCSELEKFFIQRKKLNSFAMKPLDMKRKASGMSASLVKNVVIPREAPLRVVSDENLYRYQEQVSFHW